MELIQSFNRVRVNPNNPREYGPVTIQDLGYSKVRVEIDVSQQDQQDVDAAVSLEVQVRPDINSEWETWMGCVTYGSTDPRRAALFLDPETERPWIERSYPPVGWELRAFLVTLIKGIHVGIRILGE